jgi:phosphatidylserine/phosphatidylglycerophosphate/cardiolipin synthase-like enzyme
LIEFSNPNASGIGVSFRGEHGSNVLREIMFSHQSQIYVEPESGTRPITQFIENARSELGIDIYYLSDRKVIRAIHQADRNGIITYVILEQHPYRMSSRLVDREMA